MVAHVDLVQRGLEGGDDSGRPVAQVESAAGAATVDPGAPAVVVPDAHALATAGDEVHPPHAVHVDLLGRYVTGEVVEELLLRSLLRHGVPLFGWRAASGPRNQIWRSLSTAERPPRRRVRFTNPLPGRRAPA